MRMPLSHSFKNYLRLMSLAGLSLVASCSVESGFDAAIGTSTGRRGGDAGRDFGVFDFSKECGLPQDKLDDDNATMFEQTLTSLPIKISGTQMGVGYDVTTQAKLSISSTSKRATQNIRVNVLQTSANAPSGGGLMGLIIGAMAPGIVKNTAEKQAGENSGTTTSDALPQKEWLHLVDGGNAQYKGILCGAQGGRTVTRNQGKDTVVIQYSPALVSSISPLAPIERLRKEIGQGRRFNITANVQGGGAGYASGSVQGTTVVRETNPVFDCQGTTKQADIAYEFVNNFPGGAHKVGLPKRQVMYIDSKNKKFVAIINEDDKVDPQLKKTLPPVCLVSD